MGQKESTLNDGLKPISKSNACGENCRKTEEFLALKDSVRKVDHVNSGLMINWSRIAKHSLDFLTTQSKDSLVAAYLTVAWTHINGFGGLADALEFMKQFVSKYGMKLYPQNKPKAQEISFDWMVKHLLQYCKHQDMTATNVALLDKTIKQAEALDKIVRKKLSIDTIARLSRYLKGLLEQHSLDKKEVQNDNIFSLASGDAQEPSEIIDEETLSETVSSNHESENDVVEAKTTQTSIPTEDVSNPESTVSPTTESLSEESEEKIDTKQVNKTKAKESKARKAKSNTKKSSVNSAQKVAVPEEMQALKQELNTLGGDEDTLTEKLLSVSLFLMNQYPFELQAFMYSRAVIWHDVQYVEKRLQEDDLSIPAPSYNEQQYAMTLMQEEFTIENFIALEEIARNNPYWFDVHYWVAEQSVVLSDETVISNFLISMLKQMLQSFPSFKQMTFEDGSPCVSADLLDILSVEDNVGLVSESDTLHQAMHELPTLKESAAKQCLDTIQQDINTLASAKLRLLNTLKLVRVLPSTAISNYLPLYLKQIETDFHHFHLEEWDPELAVKVLSTLCTANKSLGNQANNEQIQFALAKLMIMDHTRFTELESCAEAS